MSLLEGGAAGGVTLDVENNGPDNPDSVQTVQNTNAPSCDVEDTGNDDELLKGLLTDTFCQVCEAVLLFESQRVSHYEGKKHAQKVRLFLQTKKAEKIKQSQANSSFQSGNVNPEKFCELCNMVFSSAVVAKSHYEGKVHAKNMRKSDTVPSTDMKTTAIPVTVPVAAQEGAAEGKADQEQKESPDSPTQEVNLNDPDKYCRLCTASFNNPAMAQQHYSGRKHQRNQTRQEMLSKLSSESDNAITLTCPVCCVTLSSAETYQAHVQGNKHFTKEKKIVGLCKSQKKVYGSFQDELADYIQVQKAWGLEPKTKAEEELEESESFEEEPEMPPPPPPSSSRLPPPPPVSALSSSPSFRPPQWRPPFQPRTGRFGFRGRFPMQPVQRQWGRGYPPHPPPLIPGLTGRSFRRGRSPDSFSSSSSSSSSSSYSSSTSGSSSSSDSGSDSSSDRRRRRRKRKERMKRRREQDDDSNKDERRRSSKRRQRGREHEEEEEGHARKAKREKRMSFEEDQGMHEEKERRKRREKRHREGDSSEEDEHRTKRRLGKKNRREKEGRYGKRRREEDEGEKELRGEEGGEQSEGVQSEGLQVTAVEPTEERTELRGEEKSKRKKEKKKAKDKTDEGDKRTEEEKLWDETILGIF